MATYLLFPGSVDVHTQKILDENPACCSSNIFLSFKKLLCIHFFFLPHWQACGILFPEQGMNPYPPILEAHCLNCWTGREVPRFSFPYILLSGELSAVGEKPRLLVFKPFQDPLGPSHANVESWQRLPYVSSSNIMHVGTRHRGVVEFGKAQSTAVLARLGDTECQGNVKSFRGHQAPVQCVTKEGKKPEGGGEGHREEEEGWGGGPEEDSGLSRPSPPWQELNSMSEQITRVTVSACPTFISAFQAIGSFTNNRDLCYGPICCLHKVKGKPQAQPMSPSKGLVANGAWQVYF